MDPDLHSLIPSLRLPLEIIYDIINLVIQNESQDIATIRACSLVCQAFIPQCQAVLFSTLDIFVMDKPPQGETFPNKATRYLSAILQRKPHLAAHFHTLHWGINDSSINAMPGFLPILQRIREHTKIRTLRLYSSHPEASHGSFRDTRLLYRLITPFITRLEMINVHLNDAYAFFKTCTNLKELQLDRASSVFDPVNIGAIAKNFRPRLQTYDDQMSFGSIYITQVIDLSNLRALKIHLDFSDSGDLQAILSICARTLEELYIKKTEDRDCLLPPSLILSSLPSLRVLELDVDDHSDFGRVRSSKDSFTQLDNTLGTIPTENKIEVLILNFFFDVKAVSELDTTFNLPWEVLTSQIPRISAGKPLRVLLRFVYSPSMIPEANWAAIATDEKFGSICESVFQRLVLGRRLITFPSHIKCDISQSVLRL